MKSTRTKTVDGARWLLNQRHRDNFTVAGYKDSPLVYILTPQIRCTTDTGRSYFIYGQELTFTTVEDRAEYMRWNHAATIYHSK